MDKNCILSILGLAVFVVMADNWVVSPILPAISRDIGANVAEFAAKARGAAMSLVAFCFMCGGSLGN